MGCSDSSSVLLKTEKIKKINIEQFTILKKEKLLNEKFNVEQINILEQEKPKNIIENVNKFILLEQEKPKNIIEYVNKFILLKQERTENFVVNTNQILLLEKEKPENKIINVNKIILPQKERQEITFGDINQITLLQKEKPENIVQERDIINIKGKDKKPIKIEYLNKILISGKNKPINKIQNSARIMILKKENKKEKETKKSEIIKNENIGIINNFRKKKKYKEKIKVKEDEIPINAGMYNKNFLLLLKQNTKRSNKNNNVNNEFKEKEKDKTTFGDSSENESPEINPLKFDKNLCKSIFSSLPTRKQIKYQSLKNLIKSKTENLSDKEKSYIVFLWICDNITYDLNSLHSGRYVDCSPEGVFKNGSSVCSGYAKLYKDICIYLNLRVECVSCYSKGAGYKVGDKINKVDHEYNVIKLWNKWYPIDSTWGAGHSSGNKYCKFLDEFYFLANPELLIKTHFPEDEKWQLTKQKYTLNEFLNWPLIKSIFYNLDFEQCFPEEGIIQLKNSNSQKFLIYGNNLNNKGVTCNIYLLEGNCYKEQSNLSFVNFCEDRFEINTVFNKKGKYIVRIFGKDDQMKNYSDMLEQL